MKRIQFSLNMFEIYLKKQLKEISTAKAQNDCLKSPEQ